MLLVPKDSNEMSVFLSQVSGEYYLVKKIKKTKFEKVKFKKLEKGIWFQIISKVWEMSTQKKKKLTC